MIAHANDLPEGAKGIISDYLVAVNRVNPELLDWMMNEMMKDFPTITDPTIASINEV